MPVSSFSKELNAAIATIFQPNGFDVRHVTPEQESKDYGAFRFQLNNQAVVFRTAKTTPTKVGQFVTLWKRPTPAGEIAPFDSGDDIDFVVIAAKDKMHSGHFVFSKDLLLKHGVMSNEGKGGKRALRIYPPWLKPIAKQALKTQAWQLPYFCFDADREKWAEIFAKN